jgi:F0F1-type ATP synthase assembly protein I
VSIRRKKNQASSQQQKHSLKKNKESVQIQKRQEKATTRKERERNVGMSWDFISVFATVFRVLLDHWKEFVPVKYRYIDVNVDS